MTRTKAATMDEKAQVVNLRELGLSSSAIAEQTGLSVRTVQRISKANGVTKGGLSETVLAEGRRRLRESVLSDENAKDAVVTHLLDDIAQVKRLREKSAEVLEGFNPKNDRDRAVYMRAAAAHSTVLKNTSEIMQKATDLERFRAESTTEQLPELVIRVMDEEDVARERARQREQAKELGYYTSDSDD